MPTVKVSTKGQVVIPAEIRDKYGIRPGAVVDMRGRGEEIVLTLVPDDPVEASFGAFAHLESMIPGLLQDKREERQREERGAKWPPKGK